jgi:hypothetical protein
MPHHNYSISKNIRFYIHIAEARQKSKTFFPKNKKPLKHRLMGSNRFLSSRFMASEHKAAGTL